MKTTFQYELQSELGRKWRKTRIMESSKPTCIETTALNMAAMMEFGRTLTVMINLEGMIIVIQVVAGKLGSTRKM
jgi:hypothetical protein